MKGHENVVRSLIAHGADVNAKANNGGSPMAVALQEDHTKVIGLLVRAGAQPAESRSSEDWVIQARIGNSVSYVNAKTGEFFINPKEASIMSYEAAAMIARKASKLTKEQGLEEGQLTAVPLSQAIKEYQK
jgi:ankyrin repeat protein